mmetsp:Transcript_20353/g.23501  ORF Transcript_20353/g.23501 Transcript_20353/m.23501 type:complete len:442 (-) Transcript_20353:416-1741(-)
MSTSGFSSSDLSIAITGSASSYTLTYSAAFTSNTTLQIDVVPTSVLMGNNNENMTITLDRARFYSTGGMPLDNNAVWCHPYQFVKLREAVEKGSTAISSMLILMVGGIMSTNVLLQDKLELHWAFLNCLQLMYYFPFFNVYLPEFLVLFIQSFSVSKFDFNIPVYTDLRSSVKTTLFPSDSFNTTISIKKFQENDITTSSVIVNLIGTVVVFSQGVIICIIVYALKAIFISIPTSKQKFNQTATEVRKKGLKDYSEENKNANTTREHGMMSRLTGMNENFKNGGLSLGNKITHQNQPEASDETRQKSRLRRCRDVFILEQAKDYRFEFFVRFALQAFLDVCLMAALNLCTLSFSSAAEVVSYVGAVAVMVCVLVLIAKTYLFVSNHFQLIQQRSAAVPGGFEVLYAEYKTDSKIHCQFHALFMARRLFYCAGLTLLTNFPF